MTSEGLARGWTSELVAESIRLLWLILCGMRGGEGGKGKSKELHIRYK